MKMRTVANIAIGFLGLTLAACGKEPLPPILAGIDCTKENVCQRQNQALTARLLRKYPIGSNQDILDRDLMFQGFQRTYKGITRCTKKDDPPKIGVTQVDCPADNPNWNPKQSVWFATCGGAFVCNRWASVHWSSDGQGRITSLHAGYTVTAGWGGL
jgi:hypothetical protein